MQELPSLDTERWVKSKKYAVVRAIRQGKMTVEQAMADYNLSGEELYSWCKFTDKWGVLGLRATRVQYYNNKLRAVS